MRVNMFLLWRARPTSQLKTARLETVCSCQERKQPLFQLTASFSYPFQTKSIKTIQGFCSTWNAKFSNATGQPWLQPAIYNRFSASLSRQWTWHLFLSVIICRTTPISTRTHTGLTFKLSSTYRFIRGSFPFTIFSPNTILLPLSEDLD